MTSISQYVLGRLHMLSRINGASKSKYQWSYLICCILCYGSTVLAIVGRAANSSNSDQFQFGFTPPRTNVIVKIHHPFQEITRISCIFCRFTFTLVMPVNLYSIALAECTLLAIYETGLLQKTSLNMDK